MAAITRRREWVGRGVKRYMEILPPPFGKVPPVAGYTSWFDGDDLSTFTLVGGSMVNQWSDKGSGANHATPPSDIRTPVLARHLTLFRGRPALRFLGPQGVNGAVLSSNASASDMSQTAFVVGMTETLDPTGTLLGCQSDGGNRFKFTTAGFLATDKADLAAVGEQSNASITVGTPFVAVQALTASDVTHYLNGVSETDAHAQTFTAARTLQIGGSTSIGSGNASYTGWICEIIIYDTTLNSTDIASVAAWLRSKWAV